MSSCTNSRRVLVQRCPAVPTAPKVMAGMASFKSADLSTIMALLPPSSSSERPMRLATCTPTCLPTSQEPVKDTRLTRGSSTNFFASSLVASLNIRKTGGKPLPSSASLTIFCTATEHRGTLGDGFQIEALPAMAAINAFQLHTATGKLKAEIMPTTPSGCHCSYMR